MVVNQDSIKSKAKEIMDNFMESMKDIEVEEDFVLEREQCYREEGEGKLVDDEFRQRFFKNAPILSGDCILAKKGDWE